MFVFLHDMWAFLCEYLDQQGQLVDGRKLLYVIGNWQVWRPEFPGKSAKDPRKGRGRCNGPRSTRPLQSLHNYGLWWKSFTIPLRFFLSFPFLSFSFLLPPSFFFFFPLLFPSCSFLFPCFSSCSFPFSSPFSFLFLSSSPPPLFFPFPIFFSSSFPPPQIDRRMRCVKRRWAMSDIT